MDKDANIYIAGHAGLAGSAIIRSLKRSGYQNLIVRAHEQLNLINQSSVEAFFADKEIDFVFLAAGKVGGIYANNTYRAEFIYQNLMIEANVIHSAYQAGVKNMIFLGSSCIYPRACPQPINESYLLSGPLELTNEPYAVAKIAGIKLCESYNMQYGTNYVSVMPTNLYGPNDNYDLDNSHVLPALIRKAHEAKINDLQELTVWGSGNPRREFLHVDDMADACVFLMRSNINRGVYNIGSGHDVTIAELANTIAKIVGYEGDLVFDSSKPDGTPRKLLDNQKLKQLGWTPNITLEEGIADTYRHFLNTHSI